MVEFKDLFRIQRQSKLPLYELIEQNFRDLILSERLSVGDAVPSEWDLADLYGVSRLTVRRALDDLAHQGWLTRRHGVGTFISNPKVTHISPSKLSFTEQMRAIGRSPSSRLIQLRVIPACQQVASHLKLRENEEVVEIVRVRLADNIPILLETAYLSFGRFPELANQTSLESESLYQFLSAYYHITVASMDQTIEPVLLTESEAQHLNSQAGLPAIRSEVVSYSADGEPIEHSWSVTRGDQCKFYFHFQRGDSAF